MPKRLDPQEGGPLGGEGLDPSPLPMLCACRQHAGNQHCPTLSFSPPAKVRVQGRSTWLDEDQARGGSWGGGLWRLWRGCERMGPMSSRCGIPQLPWAGCTCRDAGRAQPVGGILALLTAREADDARRLRVEGGEGSIRHVRRGGGGQWTSAGSGGARWAGRGRGGARGVAAPRSDMFGGRKRQPSRRYPARSCSGEQLGGVASRKQKV